MDSSSSKLPSSAWPGRARIGGEAPGAEQSPVLCALDAEPQMAAGSPLRGRQINLCAAIARAHIANLDLPRSSSSAADLEFERDHTDTADTHRLIGRYVSVAREMGVAVVSVMWPDDFLRGMYLDDAGLIALNAQLRAFQVLETLTHELIHAAYRDRSSTVWTESRAEVAGAMLCLDLVGIRRRRTDASSGEVLWSTAGVLNRQRSAISELVRQRVEGW